MLTIGVIAIQGAISEHIVAFAKAASGVNYKILRIKKKGLVENCDCLVIPGGESTTISRLLRFEGLHREILKNQDIPMMGTCAGLILLSNYKDQEVEGLGLMDMVVIRNAFGRQAESFELPLDVKIFDSPFNAIFIRAPAIQQVGKGIDVLARFEQYGVAVQQGNKLALSFHPELSGDLRFHKYFLEFLNV